MDISYFETADSNKDGKVTQEEAMKISNPTMLREWVAIFGKIPKCTVRACTRRITRKEFEKYLRNPSYEFGFEGSIQWPTLGIMQ